MRILKNKNNKDECRFVDANELIDAMSQVQIESEEGRRWQEYFIRMIETKAKVKP